VHQDFFSACNRSILSQVLVAFSFFTSLFDHDRLGPCHFCRFRNRFDTHRLHLRTRPITTSNMKQGVAAVLLAISLTSASPFAFESHKARLLAREVPQEHSHNVFLDLVRTSLQANNPQNIQDPVFGLLGNAAAAAGAGSVTNLDCLQQATADQAFTNAKAAGDIPGMAGALMYRGIERNTGKVGLASVLCTETAVNPEIQAISQHQDPASSGAAATNKAITLELAKQLAGVGADPLLALEAGTFAPGDLNDSTGKGNACDTADDEPGCIFTEKLLQLDASEEEISSAVAGITASITGTGAISATDIDLAALTAPAGGAAVAAATTTAAAAAATDCSASAAAVAVAATSSSCTVITMTMAAAASSTLATVTGAAAVAATSSASSASGVNVQAFAGSLGGPPPPVISTAGAARAFSVNGDTFVGSGAALSRSCAIQHNACANAANSGSLSGGVAQCDT
jgi:hypothetical protein